MSRSPDGEASATRWSLAGVDECLAELGSGHGGLSQQQADERLQAHGENRLDEAPPRSRLAVFAAQFADVMILVLLAAAVVSGVIGDLIDTLVIIAVVGLNALLGFMQEIKAEQAMTALRAMAAPMATVRRDGHPRVVPAARLVPGDVVQLEAGAIVPADLRLIEVANLAIDESALTGESVPVDKHAAPLADKPSSPGERHNIAHKGSTATAGRAVGVVVATGMQTELGRIAGLLARTRTSQTPLQRRLAQFGRRLALVVIAICVVIFTTGLLRGEPPLHMLLVALSVAVAAIPEALVAVVSIALARGAARMARHHALLRRLAAVEALGSVTVICSDKTGTLTENRMRVERYWCEERETSEPGSSGDWQHMMLALALSHDAYIGQSDDAEDETVGDPTELALLRAAQAAGADPAALAVTHPRLAEIPFDSTRKLMTTLHRDGDAVLALVKGAPEMLIPRCTGSQGQPLDEAGHARLQEQAGAFAAQGLRVLAFARRRMPALPQPPADPATESDLEFLGLVGMIDPPREAVPDAIAACVAAGILPVMITGDHPLTAGAIASRLGITSGAEDELVTGAELSRMPQQELERRVRQIRVYARMAPEQKVRIVEALRARGEVVAMTGDGVNDAPALRGADIGVAMGAQGTDVARQAAAMVLLDDNFATIVRAVGEGRRIYDNLRRFVRYVLTTNSAEVWTIFLAPFLGLPVPLHPIQILWINLLSDGLPGLALAAEPAEPDVMRRKPRPPRESLFAGGLGLHALVVGLAMAAIALGLQASYLATDSWQTIVFTALCFMQLGHAMAVRSETRSVFSTGLHGNPFLVLTIAGTVVLQLAVVYVPSLQPLFSTVALTATELAACFAAGLAVPLMIEIEKAWRRAHRPGVQHA